LMVRLAMAPPPANRLQALRNECPLEDDAPGGCGAGHRTNMSWPAPA